MADPPVVEQPVTADPETRPGQLPLPADGLGSLAYWTGEIKASQDQIEQDQLPEWRKSIHRYQNKPLGTAPTDDTVWVPKDYALTERKRADLWFKMPDLFCQPKPGQSPQTAHAAPVFAAVLNQKMGPDHLDADTVMTEVTFDAICPAGLMVSVLSYEATVDGTKPVQVDEIPDPMTGQPVPQFKDAPNVIFEQYAWKRVSPAFLIAASDWVGSKYDDGPFLGHRFEMDRQLAMTRWNLTDDECPEGREPLKTLNEAEARSADRAQRKVVTGVRLEYKTHLYDPTVKHPQRLRELVLLDGMDQPVVHRDSPHQTVTETGQLSGDSVLVFTTRVGSIRTISDGKFPHSDCQQSRPQVDELSTGRTQMIQQRNRNIPIRVASRSMLDKSTQEKIEKGIYQQIILTDGDPSQLLHVAQQATFPRENFAFNDQIEEDLEETWAMGKNQLGSDVENQTATEASLKQRNTDARKAKEQQRVKDYALGCIHVAATLIQRYADAQEYVEIVGPVGAQILQQSALLMGAPPPSPEQLQQGADPNTPTTVAWNKSMVQGSFLWTIKPDSQLRTDQAQERSYRTSVYNLMRRDPLINELELVRWTLEGFGLVGAQFIKPPQPPAEKPYNISVSVKGEDLIPYAPQYANVVQILTLEGKPPTFSAATDAMTPTNPQPGVPHGGPMPGMAPINKHEADLTGKMPGPSGEPNTAGV